LGQFEVEFLAVKKLYDEEVEIQRIAGSGDPQESGNGGHRLRRRAGSMVSRMPVIASGSSSIARRGERNELLAQHLPQKKVAP
jgi:hypothetical protein